ncbi:hypothetical protein PRVXT_001261 [Proteinivorax tanatarense]|uniref:Uncharacterized protein n=1 Tax=Proteinivorax tanatarense TaxID=1260629 RepID=A0AAU7VPV7_9FIRM
MLQVFDYYDNSLGMVVGEYEGALLVALGNHNLDKYGEDFVNFTEMEHRCARKLHGIQSENKINKRKLSKSLQLWWEKKYSHPFKYHKGVILFNLYKRDWTGFNVVNGVKASHYILLSYKWLAPQIKTELDKSKLFLDDLGFPGICCTVDNHPKVSFGEKGSWINKKRDGQVKTVLSLKSGDVQFSKKYPFLINTQKGDKALVGISTDYPIELFCGGTYFEFNG